MRMRTNGLFGSLEGEKSRGEESRGEWFPSILHLVWMFLKLIRRKGVISLFPYLDILKIMMERRGND